MDGEVDDAELRARCCASTSKRIATADAAWVCYHVIGDALRGAHGVRARRFLGALRARALAAEPTVLAPRASASHRAAGRRAHGPPPPRSRRSPSSAGPPSRWSTCRADGASPRRAKRRRCARRRSSRGPTVASEYLLAHQEYSPAMAIQGGGPYLRAVDRYGRRAQPQAVAATESDDARIVATPGVPAS